MMKQEKFYLLFGMIAYIAISAIYSILWALLKLPIIYWGMPLWIAYGVLILYFLLIIGYIIFYKKPLPQIKIWHFILVLILLCIPKDFSFLYPYEEAASLDLTYTNRITKLFLSEDAISIINQVFKFLILIVGFFKYQKYIKE